jgi:probable phosphoglycerate mutase
VTKLLLTRHGHVDGIKPARFRGRAELALTPAGLEQAAALAQRIARQWKPAAVYTSGLQRCVVTGAKIGAAVGVKAVVLDGLMDLDYGAWQMRTHDEVKAEAPEAFGCGTRHLTWCASRVASHCRTWSPAPRTHCARCSPGTPARPW